MNDYITRKIHLEFEADYEFPKEFGNSHRGCELTKIYVKPKDD